MLDIILWAVPMGIAGARIYHVCTHLGDYFFPGTNLWNVFAIWDGGNALYGSLLGGAVGGFIGCQRQGICFWSFADAPAPAMLVAQSLGRFGNYFNHELFGLPTTFPWGLHIEATNAKFPSGGQRGRPVAAWWPGLRRFRVPSGLRGACGRRPRRLRRPPGRR